MEKTLFGQCPDGRPAYLYTLKNDILTVRVTDYGCRIQAILFDGVDFACGYDTLDGYLADNSSQGAFVGRVANRIKGASFTLNGQEYRLTPNDGENHLHGTFGQTLWNVTAYSDDAIAFSHHSPSTEEGYPGDMDLTVVYRLDKDTLVMSYVATCDADTPINLTNHTYFNANGIGSGSVLEQELQLSSDRITLVDDALIPTGEHQDVTGTPYDFRSFHAIGERLGQDGVDGYDTNFFITQTEEKKVGDKTLYRAATLRSSSYQIDCYTDLPCIQVYSGNFLGSEPTFKYGVAPERQHAICLETQYEPDAIHHNEGILRAGETFSPCTAYCFSHR